MSALHRFDDLIYCICRATDCSNDPECDEKDVLAYQKPAVNSIQYHTILHAKQKAKCSNLVRRLSTAQDGIA